MRRVSVIRNPLQIRIIFWHNKFQISVLSEWTRRLTSDLSKTGRFYAHIEPIRPPPLCSLPLSPVFTRYFSAFEPGLSPLPPQSRLRSRPKAVKTQSFRYYRMELELGSRPLSVARNSGWNEDGQLSSPTQQAYYSHRRRSLAFHVPPPGPPPTQPIPSVPPYNLPTGSIPPPDYEASRSSAIHIQNLNGAGHAHDPYQRPTANLAAVPLHSQSNAHNTYRSSSSQSPPSTSPYNLSDSPPRSQLRSTMDSPHQEILPDRLRLSPTSERQNSERRPSSRRALTRALELAREAVRLDSTNDDPYAAVVAYGKSVALLSEVMERVIRGEESTDSTRRRNGRRRSVVAQEEEVKRLRSIVGYFSNCNCPLSRCVIDVPCALA